MYNDIRDKVFKSELSKFGRRQSLKNLKRCGLLKYSCPLMNTLSHLCVSMYGAQERLSILGLHVNITLIQDGFT